MKINQLEEELRVANTRLSDYQVQVETMEQEICKAQKTWKVQKISSIKRAPTVDKIIETDRKMKESTWLEQTETRSSQTEVKMHSVEVQCTSYCKSDADGVSEDKSDMGEMEKETDDSEIDSIIRESNAETLLKGK
jgi:hypothetical protein